jgi:hypothetical protein
MELGAGQEIFTAMQQHRLNADVQHYACGALMNLALNSDNQVTLMELGAGQEIVTAMQRHRTNADVQEYARRALTRIT